MKSKRKELGKIIEEIKIKTWLGSVPELDRKWAGAECLGTDMLGVN